MSLISELRNEISDRDKVLTKLGTITIALTDFAKKHDISDNEMDEMFYWSYKSLFQAGYRDCVLLGELDVWYDEILYKIIRYEENQFKLSTRLKNWITKPFK